VSSLRNLFADYAVQLQFHGDHWTVSFVQPSGRHAWDLHFATLDETIGATRTFAAWLADDKEVSMERMRRYQRDVLLLLEEAKRRHEVGEGIGTERDTELRTWFNRQMHDPGAEG
jgi:hypothetical protein